MLPNLQRGDILLGDALYGSYFVLADCVARGIDVVFEQNGGRKRVTDFRRGRRLGTKDHHLVGIRKPTQRPEWMCEAAIHQSDGSGTDQPLKVENGWKGHGLSKCHSGLTPRASASCSQAMPRTSCIRSPDRA